MVPTAELLRVEDGAHDDVADHGELGGEGELAGFGARRVEDGLDEDEQLAAALLDDLEDISRWPSERTLRRTIFSVKPRMELSVKPLRSWLIEARNIPRMRISAAARATIDFSWSGGELAEDAAHSSSIEVEELGDGIGSGARAGRRGAADDVVRTPVARTPARGELHVVGEGLA